MIEAIETEYKGYRFRSRLEARWAVFFDACGIKYQYEPEGFKAEDGTMYLPDFYLPDFDVYCEVKPCTEEKMQEIVKVIRFLYGQTINVMLLPDIPSAEKDSTYCYKVLYYEPMIRHTAFSNVILCEDDSGVQIIPELIYDMDDASQTRGLYLYIPMMPACDGRQIIISKWDALPTLRRMLSDEDVKLVGISIHTGDTPILKAAYAKARKARFEHGEKG